LRQRPGGAAVLALELFVQGLVQGSIYALIAVGLTLVYGLLLLTFGGYLGVLVTNGSGSLTLALLAAMLVVGVAGMAIYRLCYQPILDQPPYVALVASLGLMPRMIDACYAALRRLKAAGSWSSRALPGRLRSPIGSTCWSRAARSGSARPQRPARTRR
jgi:branched-subunit amino acid ABC-type transport system permease component